MPLETRRVRSDLTKTFKVVNGKYNINSESFFNTTKVEEEDTQRNYLKRGPDWTLIKFSFSNRVVDKWNSLTDTCVNCRTVNNFKDYVDLATNDEDSLDTACIK